MKVNIEVTAGPARGRIFHINQADLFIVGRAKDSKIALPNDPYLSRQHFVLEIAPPNCKITDLGSKNGTFVNGVRYGGRKPDTKIKQAPDGAMSVTIQSGEIVVGDTRLKVSVDDSEATRVQTRTGRGRSAVSVSVAPATIVRGAPGDARTGLDLSVPVAELPPPSEDDAPAQDSPKDDAPKAGHAPVAGAVLPTPADSSLGFLVPRNQNRSLQASPVPAPASNPSALHINAPPSNSNGSPRRPSSAAAHEALDEALADSRAETIRERDDNARTVFEPPPTVPCDERTVLEAPPPGIEADATVLEHVGLTVHGVAPVDFTDKLTCALCGKDASTEIGPRGRIAGAEYVCYECRASRAFTARERMSKKKREQASAVRPAKPGSSPALDMFRSSGVVYPGYDVIDVLGSGGMGVVYKAVRKRDKLVVAIKSLLPNVPVSFENYRIFHREIELTSKLKHPNIVEVIDHGHVKGAYYCVLEFVDGLSLKEYVAEMGGKLTLKQAAPLMMDTLAGLAAAHEALIETRNSGPRMLSGIVHRDLKPENILLKRDAFGWIPKIADFGIAKSFESAGMTDMTIAGVCGTPTYWPREQLTHYRYLHPATDVFSIAAVFYEILSGSCARPGIQETLVQCHKRSVSPELADFMRVIGSNPIPPIRDSVPEIPAPIAAVIDKALLEIEVPLDEVEMRETLQRLRYPNAAAFREALAASFKYSGLAI
ncbi:MAG TPA: protein kinase [Planctomycetota bacterium]|nr:protein kinase [Planctomycetota bacterium]